MDLNVESSPQLTPHANPGTPDATWKRIQVSMYLYGVALLARVGATPAMGAWDVHIGKDFCIWQCEAPWNYSLVLPDER